MRRARSAPVECTKDLNETTKHGLSWPPQDQSRTLHPARTDAPRMPEHACIWGLGSHAGLKQRGQYVHPPRNHGLCMPLPDYALLLLSGVPMPLLLVHITLRLHVVAIHAYSVQPNAMLPPYTRTECTMSVCSCTRAVVSSTVMHNDVAWDLMHPAHRMAACTLMHRMH